MSLGQRGGQEIEAMKPIGGGNMVFHTSMMIRQAELQSVIAHTQQEYTFLPGASMAT